MVYGHYIADGIIDAPVLLIGSLTAANAAALIDAFGQLASGQTDRVAVHDLPGWESRDRLSLEAVAGAHDAGCARPLGSGIQLRCVLRPPTWDQIVGLLVPFAGGGDTAHAHQHLSEHGPVTWIVSTDATW
ncbi:MAG TPA: hypothetical protein VGR59_02055 [Gemmatimonadaceae bacterium]|nr:hypothetical protein [Gemmatimonadaceae bacterium]